MKEVALSTSSEDDKILVVRNSDGQFFGTSHKCTHYGAPLVKGVLAGNRIICPWHGACFNACTGDIEDAPGLVRVTTLLFCMLQVSIIDADRMLFTATRFARRVTQSW